LDHSLSSQFLKKKTLKNTEYDYLISCKLFTKCADKQKQLMFDSEADNVPKSYEGFKSYVLNFRACLLVITIMHATKVEELETINVHMPACLSLYFEISLI
jgi:hypothetical protein